MVEYNKRYSRDEKRQKIQPFNSVYYEGDPNDWKICRLPDWMNFYGYSLGQELKGKQPKYYRKLKQRTVVMVDYGVTIGNEMGGKHFGVVMSTKDTKYKAKAIVVPLSSHYHRGYVDLGLSLFSEILKLAKIRLDELTAKINKNTKKLNKFKQKFQHQEFSFSQEDINFLKKNNLNIERKLQDSYTFSFPNGNVELNALIQQIKSFNGWEHYKNIADLVNNLDKMNDFNQKIQKELSFLDSEVKMMKQLMEKVKKYNKHTYANPGEIRTISKLRIQKFTRFSITGNVQLDPIAFRKIENAVIKNI